ncbi:MAG TPA: alpha-ketoglutarate-dependent dioxygenase AlkB [Lysobacter sp.]|nr:alpha-ketoglutarate-dependent dioxygenase AlkB [Lysobacter sp.]
MRRAPSLLQTDLFAPAPRVLAEDAEGGVTYRPRVVDDATQRCWFEHLREVVRWQAQRRPMYDRVVDVPRLTASYWLDDPKLPAALAEAAGVVRDTLGAPFNAVGLNFYRDGRDSVAPHHDKLHMLVPGQPIAVLSLGATRRMTLRRMERGARVDFVDLEPGSLFVMSHASQFVYEHGIPKTEESVGPRISCAFRVRPRETG